MMVRRLHRQNGSRKRDRPAGAHMSKPKVTIFMHFPPERAKCLPRASARDALAKAARHACHFGQPFFRQRPKNVPNAAWLPVNIAACRTQNRPKCFQAANHPTLWRQKRGAVKKPKVFSQPLVAGEQASPPYTPPGTIEARKGFGSTIRNSRLAALPLATLLCSLDFRFACFRHWRRRSSVPLALSWGF